MYDKFRRAESVDVLRGYSALFVVFSHISICWPYASSVWPWLKWTPVRVFFSGHQAVYLFFVLSGFALACMISSVQGKFYLRYLASRLARLYVPFVFSLAFSVAGYYLLSFAGFHWEKGWLNAPKPVLTYDVIVNHLTWLGVYDASEINTPVWTLVHEMRVSIVFPLIYLFIRRWNHRALLCFVLLNLLILVYGFLQPSTWTMPRHNILTTVQIAGFFAAGAWVALNIDELLKWCSLLSGTRRMGMWFLALSLYAYPFDNPWSPPQRMIGDLVTGAGVMLLIVMSFSIKKESVFFLLGRWLGKISYSLYLTHYVVVYACLIVLLPRYGAAAVWGLAVPLSLIFGYLGYLLVERPCIRLSRAIFRSKALVRNNGPVTSAMS
ncbi:MAG: hypothetical protein CTR55_04820 [Pseudomonas sp.]|uniref:acyltransferase family protein n=1 Tax=Pseudomonas sp. TaxID=306 RepID=UPI000CC5B238|nr:acyltransferase [Pseudomonas sp.]PJI50336.1 MAG: hypothetical protein CTR55_04820 [Pseudomonas sp.]